MTPPETQLAENLPIIHRLAANNSGQALVQGALNYISALMAHHQILLEEAQEDISRTLTKGCMCPSCADNIKNTNDFIAAVAVDRERLRNAGDLLFQIGTDYEEPPIEKIAEFIGSFPEVEDNSEES